MTGEWTRGGDFTFAAIGDVHGHLQLALCMAARWQTHLNLRFDAVFLCGDVGTFTDYSQLDNATLRHAKANPCELEFLQQWATHPPAPWLEHVGGMEAGQRWAKYHPMAYIDDAAVEYLISVKVEVLLTHQGPSSVQGDHGSDTLQMLLDAGVARVWFHATARRTPTRFTPGRTARRSSSRLATSPLAATATPSATPAWKAGVGLA